MLCSDDVMEYPCYLSSASFHSVHLNFSLNLNSQSIIMGGSNSPILLETQKQQKSVAFNSKEWPLPVGITGKRCTRSPSSVSTASSSAFSICSDTEPVLPKKYHQLPRQSTSSPIRYVPKTKSRVNLDMKITNRHISSDSSPQYSPVRAYMECLSPQSLKCVLVGDSGVGKTSMLTKYTTETFVKEHTPTIYDKFTTSLSVNGRRIAMTLCDTSGSDDFGHLRPLCYPQADAALICFSVVDSKSLENAKTKWAREIKRHCPSIPVILVGTHTDERDNCTLMRDFRTATKRYISRSEGQRVAASMKATYTECSLRNQQEVKRVFDEAISSALELSSSQGKTSTQCIEMCTIL